MAMGMVKRSNAPRAYGVRVGLVAGLFAIGQALLSAAAAHGSEAAVRSMQQALNTLTSGGIADPTLLIGPLVPMLLTTYLSMLGIGLLCVWFAAQAGRMAATAQGRRAGGAAAGMWTWLISSAIWIAASIILTVITNSDGTLTGVFTGTYTSRLLPQELVLLVGQEIIAALLCLGFCALAGAQGARNVALVAPDPFPVAAPALAGYPPPGWRPYAPYPAPGYPPTWPPQYPPYPPQTQAGYPAYPGYPAGWPPPPPSGPQTMAQPQTAPVYPPPPSFYMPQPAPTPASEPPASATTPPTPPPAE
ncbi:MAG TPA: hypothetical protein VF725_05550 [Ktedonobacterales bacterium]